MKYIAALAILVISIESLAWQEERYDWDSLTYTTYLAELEQNANLKVSISKSKENKFFVSKIELTVGENLLEIPPEILKQYKFINPILFSISASKKDNENSITIYFTYDGEKNGSVSFKNYKYSLSGITEGS